MVTIFFESHGTTLDNEANLSSGHYDVELSLLGRKQAQELGDRYKKRAFAVIFCADSKRGYHTADIAFGGKDSRIIQDRRLRECDYGDLTRCSKEKFDFVKADYVNKPFPSGESFTQTTEYMRQFLNDVLDAYNEKVIIIIGSRATQYGLDHWLKGIPLREVVAAPWKWQPGWRYEMEHVL